MKITTKARFKTRIIDATTGAIVKETDWRENLILDQGLNGLAGSGSVTSLKATPAGCFAVCAVGSGTNPNSTSNGSITFTQAGNIITASGAFFDVSMVGQLFKYGTGTGGAEYYITGFTNATTVTVDTSATVGTPTAGTVWNVTQTALATPLYKTSTYQTLSGNCQSVISGNQITHQRYFIFPQQATTYTVNEIGYASQMSTISSPITGRFVLPSSDVITNTQFYLVIMQFIVTYTPATPAAASNVGTNINTAGTIMLETIGQNGIAIVQSSGAVTTAGFLEQGAATGLFFSTATYSQNASPASTPTGGVNWGATVLNPGSATWTYASARGKMTVSFTASMTTSGQSLFGIGIGPVAGQIQLDVKFTATQTAPTGNFQPNTVWACVYDRVLSN